MKNQEIFLKNIFLEWLTVQLRYDLKFSVTHQCVRKNKKEKIQEVRQ